MRAIALHLRYRLLAGMILAVTGNSSAAANSQEQNVLNFRAASPVMRPQTISKSRSRASTNNSSTTLVTPITFTFENQEPAAPAATTPFPAAKAPAPVAPVTTTPAVSTPAASTPAVSAPATTGSTSAIPPIPSLTSQGSSPLSNPPVLKTEDLPIAEAPDKTHAGATVPGVCPECDKAAKAKGTLTAQLNDIKDVNKGLNEMTDNADLKNKLALEAVKAAVAKRTVSNICGGGERRGNVSKCACAGGVKDALLRSGICASRPANYIDAVMMAGLPRGTTAQLSRTGPSSSYGTSLSQLCPAVHQTKGRFSSLQGSVDAAKSAPAGSVIVYSTSRHKYGHIETKIQVTAENYSQIRRNIGNVKVGDYLYCSDFCSTRPTFSHGTNRVEAIYSL